MKNTLFFDSKIELGLFESIKKEVANIGHYKLPEQDTQYLTDYVDEINKLQKNIAHIVVVGIGGSSLGAQAIYEFLATVRTFKRKLHFLDSTNPVDLACVMAKIDLSTTHFIVASKSGNTVEVIALYKYLLAQLKTQNINPDVFSFITENNSDLQKHAQDKNAPILTIDTTISGRFSVFSAIGLAPLSLIGVDIKSLLSGASAIKHSFFHQGYMQDTLLKKASYYAKNSPYININTVFSYSQSLHFFNHWFVQLWGESLGKQQQHSSVNVGLTPIGLIGPKDQHSFLQLLTQGKRDKSITFIKLNHTQSVQKIPDISLTHLSKMDHLNNLSFSDLINHQADATIESLQSYGDVPIDVIELNEQNEHSIGSLMMSYQLLTSLVGCLLDLNTYNQPGVEGAKIILHNKLQK